MALDRVADRGDEQRQPGERGDDRRRAAPGARTRAIDQGGGDQDRERRDQQPEQARGVAEDRVGAVGDHQHRQQGAERRTHWRRAVLEDRSQRQQHHAGQQGREAKRMLIAKPTGAPSAPAAPSGVTR